MIFGNFKNLFELFWNFEKKIGGPKYPIRLAPLTRSTHDPRTDRGRTLSNPTRSNPSQPNPPNPSGLVPTRLDFNTLVGPINKGGILDDEFF
jgi:hypothetical protein